MNIEMYIDPDTLGRDSEYPEAFVRYCEERLASNFPYADITIKIGSGVDNLPHGLTGNDLWDGYCSLSNDEYRRLANAIPEERRHGYLKGIC